LALGAPVQNWHHRASNSRKRKQVHQTWPQYSVNCVRQSDQKEG
jgi:hypothetical protein